MTARRHGHIIPLPGGSRTRCGGPGRCRTCKYEQQQVRAVASVLHIRCVDGWEALRRADPQRAITYHGLDAHFADAHRVLLVLDGVEADTDLRSTTNDDHHRRRR